MDRHLDITMKRASVKLLSSKTSSDKTRISFVFRSEMCNMTSKEKLRLAAQDARFIRPAAGYRLFQEVIYDNGEVAIGVGTY